MPRHIEPRYVSQKTVMHSDGSYVVLKSIPSYCSLSHGSVSIITKMDPTKVRYTDAVIRKSPTNEGYFIAGRNDEDFFQFEQSVFFEDAQMQCTGVRQRINESIGARTAIVVSDDIVIDGFPFVRIIDKSNCSVREMSDIRIISTHLINGRYLVVRNEHEALWMGVALVNGQVNLEFTQFDVPLEINSYDDLGVCINTGHLMFIEGGRLVIFSDVDFIDLIEMFPPLAKFGYFQSMVLLDLSTEMVRFYCGSVGVVVEATKESVALKQVACGGAYDMHFPLTPVRLCHEFWFSSEITTAYSVMDELTYVHHFLPFKDVLFSADGMSACNSVPYRHAMYYGDHLYVLYIDFFEEEIFVACDFRGVSAVKPRFNDLDTLFNTVHRGEPSYEINLESCQVILHELMLNDVYDGKKLHSTSDDCLRIFVDDREILSSVMTLSFAYFYDENTVICGIVVYGSRFFLYAIDINTCEELVVHEVNFPSFEALEIQKLSNSRKLLCVCVYCDDEADYLVKYNQDSREFQMFALELDLPYKNMHFIGDEYLIGNNRRLYRILYDESSIVGVVQESNCEVFAPSILLDDGTIRCAHFDYKDIHYYEYRRENDVMVQSEVKKISMVEFLQAAKIITLDDPDFEDGIRKL
ncbi:hypothetical protein PCE1_001292 [Barthelona sp. PCE]